MDVVQVTSAISVFFLKSQEPVYRLALRAPGPVRVKQVPITPVSLLTLDCTGRAPAGSGEPDELTGLHTNASRPSRSSSKSEAVFFHAPLTVPPRLCGQKTSVGSLSVYSSEITGCTQHPDRGDPCF